MIDATIDQGFTNIRMLLRQFGEQQIRPAGIEADRSGEPLPEDHKLFRAFGKIGLQFGMLQREGNKKSDKPKGPSRNSRTAVIAAEELAFWDQGATMSLPGPGLGGPPLQIMGTPVQKQKYLLDPFKDPNSPRWGAYGLTEPAAGSDVARIRATARKDGKHYILNGEKMFITNGARATWCVIFASVDPNAGRAGHRAFIVEKGMPGYTASRIEKKMGLTASETAGLVLEDVRVPE